MGEEWRTIRIAPKFLVSSHGRVKKESTGRLLKIQPAKKKHEYPSVTLEHDRRWFRKGVHILVAMAFVDGEAPGLLVNHKDGNKSNPLPDNLEWVTHKENMRHATMTGLRDGVNRVWITNEFGQQVEVFRNKEGKWDY
jgi:hypothetical protein